MTATNLPETTATLSPGDEKYLPQRQRQGTALCLSGGGFRAALFHLGALRRLNELGLLGLLDTLTSVSGGSIIAAHLAQRLRPWPVQSKVSDWETAVARPFREFAAHDIRTQPILHRLLPWHWFDSAAQSEALAEQYARRLTRLTLADLPERPRFVLCATDMAFGTCWTFERTRAGDYQAGYLKPTVLARFPLATAVAASSCFPPVFKPMPMHLSPEDLTNGRCPNGSQRQDCIDHLALTDGGVYDNMGLEPVWKSHRVILVSDGGAPFQFTDDTSTLSQLTRFTDIMGNQAASLRKRWLIASFVEGALAGAYWGIGSAAERYGITDIPGAYSKSLATDCIAKIRTDLDGFTEPEMCILENHGYLLTEAAVRAHASKLLPVEPIPLATPHPDWLDESRVRRALKDSPHRSLFGRG